MFMFVTTCFYVYNLNKKLLNIKTKFNYTKLKSIIKSTKKFQNNPFLKSFYDLAFTPSYTTHIHGYKLKPWFKQDNILVPSLKSSCSTSNTASASAALLYPFTPYNNRLHDIYLCWIIKKRNLHTVHFNCKSFRKIESYSSTLLTCTSSLWADTYLVLVLRGVVPPLYEWRSFSVWTIHADVMHRTLYPWVLYGKDQQ